MSKPIEFDSVLIDTDTGPVLYTSTRASAEDQPAMTPEQGWAFLQNPPSPYGPAPASASFAVGDEVAIPGRVIERDPNDGALRVRFGARGSDQFHMWCDPAHLARVSASAPSEDLAMVTAQRCSAYERGRADERTALNKSVAGGCPLDHRGGLGMPCEDCHNDAERRIEERLVVTDLCDVIGTRYATGLMEIDAGFRIVDVCRRAVNFIEGHEVFDRKNPGKAKPSTPSCPDDGEGEFSPCKTCGATYECECAAHPADRCEATHHEHGRCVFGRGHLIDYHSDGSHRWSTPCASPEPKRHVYEADDEGPGGPMTWTGPLGTPDAQSCEHGVMPRTGGCPWCEPGEDVCPKHPATGNEQRTAETTKAAGDGPAPASTQMPANFTIF